MVKITVAILDGVYFKGVQQLGLRSDIQIPSDLTMGGWRNVDEESK